MNASAAQPTSPAVGLAALQRQRRVDRPAKQDRGQHDGRVHDDAGGGAEHELARHLSEVRPHRPEEGEHPAPYGATAWCGRATRSARRIQGLTSG